MGNKKMSVEKPAESVVEDPKHALHVSKPAVESDKNNTTHCVTENSEVVLQKENHTQPVVVDYKELLVKAKMAMSDGDYASASDLFGKALQQM